jgi:hypothetical protein
MSECTHSAKKYVGFALVPTPTHILVDVNTAQHQTIVHPLWSKVFICPTCGNFVAISEAHVQIIDDSSVLPRSLHHKTAKMLNVTWPEGE